MPEQVRPELAYTSLSDLTPDEYVVIDRDTGTVIGINLNIVPWPKKKTEQENIISSNFFALEYANRRGRPLHVRGSIKRWRRK